MSTGLDTRREPAAGAAAAIGLLAALLPLTALLVDERAAPFVAGAVLMAAGFASMAPCELQMAGTLARVLAAISERRGAAVGRGAVRRAAVVFAAGYVLLYLPVALALGGLAVVLGPYAWTLLGLAALVTLTLGLAALGHGPAWLKRCRGPLWLLRSGRASFERPFRAGLVFGQYCAACCGPYVYALALLAGGGESFWLGGAMVLGYAVLMALPFLATAVLAPETYGQLSRRVGVLAPVVARATGAALVGLGIVLVGTAVVGALA
jgi:cytochrome c biogenesis protein CcdA